MSGEYQTAGIHFSSKTDLGVFMYGMGPLPQEAHFSPWISPEESGPGTAARLTMLYKINSGDLPLSIPKKFTSVGDIPDRAGTCSQRPNQYINHGARTMTHKYSFYPRTCTVTQWNILPASIIHESTSTKSFNTKVWSYMYTDKLSSAVHRWARGSKPSLIQLSLLHQSLCICALLDFAPSVEMLFFRLLWCHRNLDVDTNWSCPVFL